MKWSDATSHLGLYLELLATEYRQLTNNGWSTARTEYELAKALNAYERLVRDKRYVQSIQNPTFKTQNSLLRHSPFIYSNSSFDIGDGIFGEIFVSFQPITI